MITTEQPSEFRFPGYEACVYYDPEVLDYDFSEWEDGVDTGWFNFDRQIIDPALGEYANPNIDWEPYDAGSIFYGSVDVCKKIYERVEAVRVEYPYFEVGLEIVDFSCADYAVNWNYFFVGSKQEQSMIYVQTDIESENYHNKIWVHEVFEDSENLTEDINQICLGLGLEFDGFYFIPYHNSSWFKEGDYLCIPFTVSSEPTNITLAYRLGEAVGYEVIIP